MGSLSLSVHVLRPRQSIPLMSASSRPDPPSPRTPLSTSAQHPHNTLDRAGPLPTIHQPPANQVHHHPTLSLSHTRTHISTAGREHLARPPPAPLGGCSFLRHSPRGASARPRPQTFSSSSGSRPVMHPPLIGAGLGSCWKLMRRSWVLRLARGVAAGSPGGSRAAGGAAEGHGCGRREGMLPGARPAHARCLVVSDSFCCCLAWAGDELWIRRPISAFKGFQGCQPGLVAGRLGRPQVHSFKLQSLHVAGQPLERSILSTQSLHNSGISWQQPAGLQICRPPRS